MDFSNLTTPQKADLLIAFMDIQGFAEIARSLKEPLRMFELLNAWARLVIADVDRTGGRVIKLIGDECMIVYPDESVDAGVRALIAVKQKAEAFLGEQGFSTRIKVTVHFGEVAVGPLGAGSCMAIDILGDAVNVAASLGRGEHRGRLVISPQAFRKLSAATRKSFHKYTPPVVYVAEQG
jgi:adenylate cyclase